MESLLEVVSGFKISGNFLDCERFETTAKHFFLNKERLRFNQGFKLRIILNQFKKPLYVPTSVELYQSGVSANCVI